VKVENVDLTTSLESLSYFLAQPKKPSFNFKNRGWKNREYHRLKHENKRLRERVEKLEREHLNHEHGLDINVPPPPMPPAPPAFSVPRRDR
jgi:hypothetical protein